jgi:hypothetical protein
MAVQEYRTGGDVMEIVEIEGILGSPVPHPRPEGERLVWDDVRVLVDAEIEVEVLLPFEDVW